LSVAAVVANNDINNDKNEGKLLAILVAVRMQQSNVGCIA
jgi:hypothetical protein